MGLHRKLTHLRALADHPKGKDMTTTSAKRVSTTDEQREFRFPYLFTRIETEDPKWFLGPEVSFEAAIMAAEMHSCIATIGGQHIYQIAGSEQWPNGYGFVAHVDEQRGTAFGYIKLGSKFFQALFNPFNWRKQHMIPLVDLLQHN